MPPSYIFRSRSYSGSLVGVVDSDFQQILRVCGSRGMCVCVCENTPLKHTSACHLISFAALLISLMSAIKHICPQLCHQHMLTLHFLVSFNKSYLEMYLISIPQYLGWTISQFSQRNWRGLTTRIRTGWGKRERRYLF